MHAPYPGVEILLCNPLTSLSFGRTVAGLRRTWPKVRSKMPAFRQWSGVIRREECVSTLRGRAPAFKFLCAKKTQLQRVRCLHQRLKATKTLIPTSKPTAPDHRGASLAK